MVRKKYCILEIDLLRSGEIQFIERAASSLNACAWNIGFALVCVFIYVFVRIMGGGGATLYG